MIEYFVRPMQGVRYDDDASTRCSPTGRSRACASAPGRPASSTAPLGERHARPAARLPARPGAGDQDLQVHRHRPAHARQDAARPPLRATRPSSRTRSPTSSPSRCGISTPTSSSSTRRTCPATRRNGSGRRRRSTACSTPCKTTPAVHLCFGNYGGQSVQSGTWEQLMRYLNALHADHVVLECAHRPPEELAVFKEPEARDRLRPRRRRHQGDRGRVGRRGRARDRARRAAARRRPGPLHPPRLRLLDAQAPDRRRQDPRPRPRPRPLRGPRSLKRRRTGRRGVGPVRPESGRFPTPRPRRHRRLRRATSAARMSPARWLGGAAWTTPRSTSSKTARSFART